MTETLYPHEKIIRFLNRHISKIGLLTGFTIATTVGLYIVHFIVKALNPPDLNISLIQPANPQICCSTGVISIIPIFIILLLIILGLLFTRD